MTVRVLYTVEERGTTVFGGAAKDLAWMIKGLDRSRFTPAFLLTGDDSFLRFLAQEKIDDIEIYRLPLPPWRKMKYRIFVPFVLRKLRKIISDGRFDLIHVNGGYNDVPYVTRVARGVGAISLFTVRSGDILGEKVRYYDFAKADCVITVNRVHQKQIEGQGVGSVVLYSGVEEKLAVEPIRKVSLGIPEEAFVIGTVANLVPLKGYPYLLQAVASLIQKFQNLWMVSVGGGDADYQNELLSLAKDLRIADRVRFVGFQPCGRQWIPLFDLFVLPSLEEAWGLSILEAMAEGKAVVASAVGGIPELVLEGVTGRLVPPRSPESLAIAIEDLIMRPEERARMGRAGRERVLRYFSLRQQVEGLQNIYTRLVAERGRS